MSKDLMIEQLKIGLKLPLFVQPSLRIIKMKE
jgi:hypothetical protein